MNADRKEEWSRFLEGGWTRIAPTEPGRYHVADYKGQSCGARLIVIQDSDSLLYVMNSRSSPTATIIWGAYFWSIAEPDMPHAPKVKGYNG